MLKTISDDAIKKKHTLLFIRTIPSTFRVKIKLSVEI